MIDERDLVRLIEGACSPEEAAAIQSWVAADPKRGELLEELRTVWRLTGSGTRRWDVAAARERLRRAGAGRAAPSARPAAPTAPPARATWRAAAAWTRRLAVASVLVALGTVVAHLRGDETPSAARVYTTARGQRATVSLADGTRVLLSADTKLSVPSGYGAGERGVQLEGEAYFIVGHDARRPFVVRTARGTARDLGTEFAVRAYRLESYLQVVVATDSVALEGPTGGAAGAAAPPRSLTLRPRDRGVIDERGRLTVVHGASLDRYLAWTRGQLVFDDAPLAEVAAELGRWYDLDVRAADPALGRERVTITFTTEPADAALSTLAQVLDLRVARAGRSVRLVSDTSAHSKQR